MRLAIGKNTHYIFPQRYECLLLILSLLLCSLFFQLFWSSFYSSDMFSLQDIYSSCSLCAEARFPHFTWLVSSHFSDLCLIEITLLKCPSFEYLPGIDQMVHSTTFYPTLVTLHYPLFPSFIIFIKICNTIAVLLNIAEKVLINLILVRFLACRKNG